MEVSNLSADWIKNVSCSQTLSQISANGSFGRARCKELYNMLYENGPGNGTMLSLAFDQLVEHGIGHTLKWCRSADPRAVIELANSGKFSAVALSIGQAERYQSLLNVKVPLIVKIDGHFLVGDEVLHHRQSNMSSVKRAVKAGANAIGFTLYFGGENLQDDIERASIIVEEAHDYGKPVVMWAYARGPLADKMGADSLYWCAQAVSVGESLGVDIVKQKFPMPPKDRSEYIKNLSKGGYFNKKMPEVDKLLGLEPENITEEMHVKRLAFIKSVAPSVFLIISGGEATKDTQGLIDSTRIVMDSGCEGRIVGRNLWGKPIEDALLLADRLSSVMGAEKYKRPHP